LPADEEDVDDPTEAPPLPTGIDVQEPDPLQSRLGTALSTVRERGRNPLAAKRALDSALPKNSTPAARLNAEDGAADPPNPLTFIKRAPVTARKLADSPGTAAAFASDNKTLDTLASMEEAFKGDFNEQRQVKENTEAAIKQQDDVINSLWDIMKGSWYRSRMTSIRADQALGITKWDDPDAQLEYDKYQKKYEETVEKSKLPEVVKNTVEMGGALAGQLATGTVAAAGTAALTAAAGPEAAVPSAGLAFHTAMSARMGYDATGAAFDKALTMKTVNGDPIDPQVARGYAISVGVINTLGAELGFKYMGKALGPIFQKFAGEGVPGQVVLERLAGWALKKPEFRSDFLKIADAGVKGARINAAFSLLNKIAEMGTQNVLAALGKEVPYAETSDTPWEDSALVEGYKEATSLEGTLLPGFFLGVAGGGGSALLGKGKLAIQKRVLATDFRTKGVPILWELSAGEAAQQNPERLREVVNAVQEAHGDPNTHATVAVPPTELRQSVPGAVSSPVVERSLQKAEQTGQEAILPTADYAAEVKTKPGAESLVGHERFGDTFTLDEQKELSKFQREPSEKDPVEEDTKKIAKDLEAKFSASGKLPSEAKTVANLYAQSMRTASLERAKSLGVEPTVFEDYAKSPVEVAGSRDNAALAFEKKLKSIVSEARGREIRKGSGTEKAKKEEAQGPVKAPLEKLREAAEKTLGETFLAFRVEGKERPGGDLPEGRAFLRAEAALAKATKEGKDVVPVFIRPGEITGADRVVINTGPLAAERAVAMDPEAVKTFHTGEGVEARKQGQNEKRIAGTIKELGKYKLITQSGWADKSTLLHEMAHYISYRWGELVPERMAAIDKWLGHEPGTDLTSAQAEKFVDGMEKYFQEGVAPNEGLIDTFSTLSRWMKGSMEGLAREGVQFDPEIRKMMEPMFAMQEETDHVSKVLGYDMADAFEGVLQTKEEMLGYREAENEARRELYTKIPKAGSAEARTARAELVDNRARAITEVTMNDINNLREWLRTGNTLDGREYGIDHMKLNYDDVRIEGFDPKEFEGLVESKSDKLIGYAPEELAAILGTGGTGREMLERMRSAEDVKTQIEDRTQEIFKERHPEFNDPRDWARSQGLLLAQGKAFERLQKYRYKILAKRLGVKLSDGFIDSALDATVRDYMRDVKAKELSPAVAFRAEAKATMEMKRAVGKGNFDEASNQARLALLNRKLFLALTEAKTEVTDAVSDLKDLANNDSRRTRIGRAGPEYLAVIDHLLTGLGFKEAPPGLDINQAAGLKDASDASLRAALQKIHERGESFPLDNQFAEPGGLQPWQRMELPMLKEAFAAIETAEYLAKQRDAVIWNGKRVAREEMDDYLSDKILKSAPWEKVEDLSKSDVRPGTIKKIKGAMASLIRPEFMFKVFGSDVDRVINQPIQEALNRVEAKGERARTALEKILRGSATENGRLESRVHNPMADHGAGREYSLRETLMQLAYFGDARNWEVMARGEGMTHAQYKQWFQDLISRGTITAKDIHTVNDLVGLTGSHWDAVRETKYKETGQKIDPVDARPEVFIMPDGSTETLKGGYVPTVYDYERARVARPADDVNSLFSPEQKRAGLPKSFTLARTESGLALPLDYDLQNAARHLADVIRYTEMYDSLTQAKVALENPKTATAIIEQYSMPVYQQFDAWLRDLAKGAGSEVPPGLNGVSKFMGYLKYGTNLKLFGWKFATAIPQLTGAIAGINDVGWKNFAIGFGKAFDPAERKRVFETSGEVKTALHMQDAAMPQAALDQVFEETAPEFLRRSEAHVQKFVKQTAFFWMKWFTQQSSMVNYLAGEQKAYQILGKEAEEAVAAGQKPIMPGTPEYEARVKHLADQVVRTADSSSSFKDLPQFFRHNKWVWSFLNLAAGYSNNIYNHLHNMGYEFKRGDYPKMVAHFLYVVAAPALATAALGRGLFPAATQGRDDKDDYKWAVANGGTAVAQTVLRSLPGVGDLGLDAAKHFMDKTPLKDHLEFFGARPLSLPIVDDLERFGDLAGTYWTRNAKDKLHGDEMEKLFYTVGNLGAEVGVPGVGQVPFQGPSSGIKMYLRLQRGELKLNDAEFFKQLIAPGQPYSAYGKGKKK